MSLLDQASIGAAPPRLGARPEAVLLDRDGTLIDDVPYNNDPDLVAPLPGARAALNRLRAAGLRLGVITNQSALARGLAVEAEVAAVNRRVERLLGPFDVWEVCPHDAHDGCDCRKPAPGMVLRAAARLGVATPRCVVVGDIGADVAAAAAAGARSVLVPTGATRLEEVAEAPVVVADLSGAVDWILGEGAAALAPAPAPVGNRVLAVRADSAGDVLLCGPAVRAIASAAESVTLLCGPRGEAAGRLLPGVADIITWATPWIDADAPAVETAATLRLVDEIAARGFDEAVIFTSFHQSALPFALLARLAGVKTISAISDDWPGSLLDVRHHVPPGAPEAERALSLAEAAGYRLPDGDEGRLRVTVPARTRDPRRVVVHPGASVAARAAPERLLADAVASLHDAGYDVLVSGGPGETGLTARVADGRGVDLGGRTTLAELAAIIAGAGAIVVANTGPAHLAAAVGTPVVSLFAPTVPFRQWRPYGVPYVRLGDAGAPCAGTRATVCPAPGHPCLGGVAARDVVDAVRLLAGEPR